MRSWWGWQWILGPWLALGLLPVARAQDNAAAPVSLGATKTARGNKSTAWSFGFTGIKRALKADNDHEIVGNSLAIQLGTAYLSDSWFTDASFDIILGPYEPTRSRQLDVDYVGTGFTAWAGFSAQAKDLRSSAGGYGFALGLSYADIVGRSIGRNHLDHGQEPSINPEVIDDYSLAVNDFSLLPAVFFCWLVPARPQGNLPELLTTRVEGYFLTLGAAMPIATTYTANYLTKGASDGHRDRGQLYGYSLLLTLKAMLGT